MESLEEPAIRNFPVYFYQVRNELQLSRKQMAKVLGITPREVYYSELGRQLPALAHKKFIYIHKYKPLLIFISRINKRFSLVINFIVKKLMYEWMVVTGRIYNGQLTLPCCRRRSLSKYYKGLHYVKEVAPFLILLPLLSLL